MEADFKKKRTPVFQNLKRAVVEIHQVNGFYVPVVGFTTAISAIIPAISLLLMQQIINQLQIGSRADIQRIFELIALYVGVDLFATMLQGLLSYFSNWFSMKFNLAIKVRILRKAGQLELKDYENSKVYDMIKRAQYESDGKLLDYFGSFLGVASLFITLTSYLVILLRFRGWIVLVVLVIPLLKYMVMDKLNRKQFEMVQKRTDQERRAWYYSYIVINGENYKELKIYRLFRYFIEKYEITILRFNRQDLQISREMLISVSLLDLMEQIISGILFSYIVYNGVIGWILIGDVVTYTRTVMSSKGQVQGILNTFSSIRKDSLFLDQLFVFLDLDTQESFPFPAFHKEAKKTKSHGSGKAAEDSTKSSMAPDGSAAVVEKKIILAEFIHEIKVEHLFYRYGKDTKYVLKDINLVLKKGELLALVGRNGSGKTTLAKIIMGFYEDYEGQIWVNGKDLRKIDKDSYMKRIGALFQDFTRFEATFRENVSYGNLSILREDKLLLEIGEKFQLSQLIKGTEKGLDTQLGYWFDDGKQISIGEWQKVALSRAFAKDADVYLLDEPNAALDAISEYDLSRLYSGLLRDKIGVLIAHRFNHFIMEAKEIIVLEEGAIAERGHHKELLQRGELYRKLYLLQIQEE